LEILRNEIVVLSLSDLPVQGELNAVKLFVLLESNKVDNGEDVVYELVDVVNMEDIEVRHCRIPGD
jgi:hypothetical protein